MRRLLLVSIAVLLAGCASVKTSETDTGSKKTYGGILLPFGVAGFGYVVKKPE